MSSEPKKPSASKAAKEAHSPNPDTRKEAMATLREKRGKSGGAKPSKKS